MPRLSELPCDTALPLATVSAQVYAFHTHHAKTAADVAGASNCRRLNCRQRVPPSSNRKRRGRSLMNKLVSVALWPLIAIVGAFSFAALALGRGETVSAVWLVTAAVCVYFIAYRFYSKFIAEQGAAAGRHARDAGRAPQRRHGLRADQQVRALRPPLRGDRRRRPAGRSGARRADGLPARHAVDPGRRGGGRRGAGFHRAVRVGAPRRQVARRDDQDGTGSDPGLHRAWSASSPS